MILTTTQVVQNIYDNLKQTADSFLHAAEIIKEGMTLSIHRNTNASYADHQLNYVPLKSCTKDIFIIDIIFRRRCSSRDGSSLLGV